MNKSLFVPMWLRPQSRSGRSRPPVGIVLLSVFAASLLLLPLAYLLFRATGVEPAVWRELWSASTGRILGRSLMLVLGVNACVWLLSLPLAWLVVFSDLPGRKLWTVLVATPLVVPSYIGAFVLIAMYGPRGLLQQWLEPLGVERLPSLYGYPGALIAITLFTYPYLFLGLRSAMLSLDQSWLDAARTLGQSGWKTFGSLLLPVLRPALAAGSILVSLYTLSDFGAVALLRYTTFTHAIYLYWQSSLDVSAAALLMLVLVILTLVLMGLEFALRGRARIARTHAGTSRAVVPVRLGRWKYAAWLLLGGTVFMGMGNPIVVSVVWLAKGMAAGASLQPVWQAAANSLLVSLLAAVTAVLVFAVPTAYLAERYRALSARLPARAAYIGFGMPGIAVALSLVFFGARHAPWVYQTTYLLILGYMVRYATLAIGPLRSQLSRINPRMEEAGRLLGLSEIRVLGRVTAPVARGGLLTGAALVFLSTMKELPVTLLLAPTGFNTLATRIWSATEEAFYARAAAPTLILLLVSALGIAAIFSGEDG